MDGDKVELTIEKVGTLKFNVKDELKRTWARTTRSQHKDKGGEGAAHAADRRQVRTEVTTRRAGGASAPAVSRKLTGAACRRQDRSARPCGRGRATSNC